MEQGFESEEEEARRWVNEYCNGAALPDGW